MELAARLQVPRSDVTVVSMRDSDEDLRVVLGVHRIGRLFEYLIEGDGQPILQPSGEPDGGYGFVPPPGIRT